MRDTGQRPGEEPDLVGVELHAMRVPDVRAGPAEVLGILSRAAAEGRERIAHVLVVLGQMGMSRTPLSRARIAASRMSSRLTEKGEQGATPTRTMAPGRADRGSVDHPDAILEDRALFLHERVRRKPALRFPDRHGAPRGMEAEPHLPGRLDRVVEPRAVGEKVEVVGRGRASRKRQFRKTKPRGRADVPGPHPRPDRVERPEPAEQERVLPAGDRPRDGLEEVVVRVDEPRRDDAACRVDRLGAVGGKPLPHGRDHAAFDPHVAARDLAPSVVHGKDVAPRRRSAVTRTPRSNASASA